MQTGLETRLNTPDRRRDLYWIAGWSLVAIALRFIQIGQESFWTDEVFSLNALREGVWDHVVHREASPPVFFYMLKWWTLLFGQSHEAMRGFSAVAGGLGAGALFWTARRWGARREVASVVALWLCVHPLLYFQSQQNRYYALLMLFGILWLGILPSALNTTRSRRPCWSYLMLGALGFATHYYFGFYLVAAGMLSLGCWLVSKQKRRDWPRLLGTHIIMGCYLLLWLPVMAIQVKISPKNFLGAPSLTDLYEAFGRLVWFGHYSGQPTWQWWLGGALLGVGILGAGIATVTQQKTCTRPLALCWITFAPMVLVWLISVFIASYFFPERYGTLFFPSFALWIVFSWEALPLGRQRRWAIFVLAGFYLVWGGVRMTAMWREQQTFDWRGTIAYVESHWQPGDAIMFHPDWLIVNYVENGGEKRNVVSTEDPASSVPPGRIWFACWEQSPGREVIAPLLERRDALTAPFLFRNSIIAVSLLPAEGGTH